MKFYLDENFPKAAHALLENLGHQTFDLRGTSREGANDSDIFGDAQLNQAIFLTTDRDFFHTIPHLYPTHFGIVVIALSQPNRANILEKLNWLLNHLSSSAYQDRAFQLRDKTWIAFPPL